MTGYEERKAPAVVPRPHGAKCEACEGFGTVLLAGAKRIPRTVPELFKVEAPCTCQAGDLFRALFAEWNQPVTLKGSKRVAALVIDPEWKYKEPIAPQRIGAAAQGLLASIGGKR